jgi:hypothetical protein
MMSKEYMLQEQLAHERIKTIGWNEAIEAAARIVETRGCGECDFGGIYAGEIRALKKETE